MMESPDKIVLEFLAFIVRQWLQWHSIQLDLLKRPRAIKATKDILIKFVKLYFVMPFIIIHSDIKTWIIM